MFKEELNFTASFSIENLAITPREGEITKREIMPYYESIKTLNKLELTTMPREKLLILRQAYSHMKTAVVDHWKGKKELLAMDDQLPLLIYVLSMSTVTHPAAQFHFLEDYLRMQNKGFDSEPMLIANLQVLKLCLIIIGQSSIHCRKLGYIHNWRNPRIRKGINCNFSPLHYTLFCIIYYYLLLKHYKCTFLNSCTYLV